MSKKTQVAEFYAFDTTEEDHRSALHDLLLKHNEGHAPSISLEPEAKEKFQIRSIKANSAKTVFMAVFGRCRYNENLEQASESTHDKDVILLPGHGLVEKNHFLFYPNLNLIVYQRNGNGSRIGKLQRYLSRILKHPLLLSAVLAEDSYTKLENSGPLKQIELSVKAPHYKETDEDKFLFEAIEQFRNKNAGRIKISLTAEKGLNLSDALKAPLIDLARAGFATVARAKVSNIDKVDISDDDESKDVIIDLILNRVRKSFEIELDENDKVIVKSIYSGLARAKDESNQKLKAFFDPD